VLICVAMARGTIGCWIQHQLQTCIPHSFIKNQSCCSLPSSDGQDQQRLPVHLHVGKTFVLERIRLVNVRIFSVPVADHNPSGNS
jgi:hypothetical protein